MIQPSLQRAHQRPLVITDRTALLWAQDLIALHGENAAQIARSRARTSRLRENVSDFCRWRTAERIIDALETPAIMSTLH